MQICNYAIIIMGMDMYKSKYKEMDAERWAVRIPEFPVEKQKQIRNLAKNNRQTVGAYIGSLLDSAITEALKKQTEIVVK